MKKFRIQYDILNSGSTLISANTIEEAIEKFNTGNVDLEYPDEGYYEFIVTSVKEEK